MAAYHISNLWEELKCPICLDFLTCATSIECGHNFCARCIHELILKTSKPRFRCPKCNTKCKKTLRPSRQLETVAQSFRLLTTHMMRSWKLRDVIKRQFLGAKQTLPSHSSTRQPIKYLDVALLEGISETIYTSGFILLGLSSNPQLQKPLFIIFLSMYLVTLLGNLLIILAIRSDSRLHTPMYFFLSILSFTDICFTTDFLPKMLVNFLSETKAISYIGCLVQMYFFMAFGNTDSYLLASMAIDRLVAICNPLHYAMLMSHRRCVILAVASCVISHLHALLRVLLMSRLSFCASHVIKHFFCDTQPVLKLSCSDTSSSQVVVMTETLAVIVTPFLCIIFSYLRIIVAILKVPSASGKWKTFSTCGSHLTIVVLFYGSAIYVYFRPLSSYSVVKDRVATVMYTVVTPMLNPFIYSLRNKDMKQGLGKLRDRIKF
ncbi:olfactory receptor 1L4-like [Trichosurus vulpecula]|uniref:olfactory receptor 1L4-like n=1 Tax=Trichosurus vulpecula TaxID=9337 RepID=UPI00186B1DA2|nr:olfactory receptor 1L4-like [Trichosurus vulpecula]